MGETKRLRVRRMLTVDSKEQCWSVGGPTRVDVQHNTAWSVRWFQFATNFGKSLFFLLAEMSAFSAISATFMNYYYFSSCFQYAWLCFNLINLILWCARVVAVMLCEIIVGNWEGKERGRKRKRDARSEASQTLFSFDQRCAMWVNLIRIIEFMLEININCLRLLIYCAKFIASTSSSIFEKLTLPNAQ